MQELYYGLPQDSNALDENQQGSSAVEDVSGPQTNLKPR